MALDIARGLAYLHSQKVIHMVRAPLYDLLEYHSCVHVIWFCIFALPGLCGQRVMLQLTQLGMTSHLPH